MAEWIGMARSNYFRVQDEAQFREWAEELELKVMSDSEGRVGFYSGTDDGDFPEYRFTDGEDRQEIDLVTELAKHLVTGEVAVLVFAGHEKARYVSGYATALNSERNRVDIVLSDLYEKAAAEFGVEVKSISEAHY